LPAYLAVVALYFLVPGVRERPPIAPLWQFLTFSRNWLVEYPTHGLKTFSHVWSLCVEEQFYLVFPAVVALIALRPTPGKVVGAALFVLILGMALRGYLWLQFVVDPPFNISGDPRGGRYQHFIYCPTATRLDGLLMGIVAAAIQTFRPAVWTRLTARPNLLLGVGALGIVLSTFIFREGSVARFWAAVFGYPFLSLAIMLIVMAGTDGRSLIGRYRVPGSTALATGAYSLYLSHKIAFHWVELMRPSLPAPLQWAAFGLAVLGAFGFGAALYWLVERPFLKLRDRFEGRSRTSLTRGGDSQEGRLGSPGFPS
jgi:peptidoglycan/LPS O-acetylase OafA/YrhL